MDASDRVMFLLQLLVGLMPVAGYFLTLGLVNCQAQPRLIGARTDFFVLTAVFCPLLLWPAPALLARGPVGQLALVAGLGTGVLVFRRLLPPRDRGWVVYNISGHRLHRLLVASFHALGWSWQRRGDRYELPACGLGVVISGYTFLRSAAIHLEPLEERREPFDAHRLRAELELRLRQQQLLPSLTGSCLLLLGVCVLIVPLWMMSRHMDAIVELMQKLFVA